MLARWQDGARIEHESLLGTGLAPLPGGLLEAAAPQSMPLHLLPARAAEALAPQPLPTSVPAASSPLTHDAKRTSPAAPAKAPLPTARART
jgi:hypothetical protein